MKKRIHVLSVLAVFALFGPAVAQDSVDSASNYSAGPLTQLDQGTGWGTGVIALNSGAGTASCETASALTESGDALMNTGSGLAWILKADVPGTSTFAATQPDVTRPVSGVTHQSGEQMFIKAEVPDGPAAGFGGLSIEFEVVPSLTTVVAIQYNTTTGNWDIDRSGGITTTTASASDPHAIVVTNNGASVNVLFENLGTSATQDYDVTPKSTGNMGQVYARITLINGFSADTATLILNDMKYNAAGGLPVELDMFSID